MSFLSSLEILQICAADASKTCLRAIDFAGQLALKSGAQVLVATDFPTEQNSFGGRGKQQWQSAGEMTPLQWAEAKPNRLLLIATTDTCKEIVPSDTKASAVEIVMECWQSECTLFAQSGLAELLGDPEREPLVPVGHYAAGTIGYAAFCALAAVYNKMRRFKKPEVASVNGVAAMSWVNWKAAASGVMDRDLRRQGKQAEWPILPCKDGYVAFVYTEGNWDSVVKVVNDNRLLDPKYDTFTSRMEHRLEYMAVVAEWVLTKTKAELSEIFFEHSIPGAPVMTPGALLDDPLFLHRQAFKTVDDEQGGCRQTPVAPYRVAQEVTSPTVQVPRDEQTCSTPAGTDLPLSGIRVLDLGIITAGAATGALLADMGAQVLKIESDTYPDPFRKWAGSSDSPLFKFNNRNKLGVGIDLKTEEGKRQFLELVATADVIVENFRRGVLERMGFTLDVLRRYNPNIVLASISGQGLDGPGSRHTTYGSTLEANSGFAAQTCYKDRYPYITGRNVNFPDQTVCLYAAAMVALAVQYSNEYNCALQVDVSQRDVSMYMLGDVIELVSSDMPDDIDLLRSACMDGEFDGIVPTADNRYVALSIPSFQVLQQVSGLEYIDNGVKLAAWAREQCSDAIEALLRPVGCGAATTLVGSEMYRLPAVQDHGVFTKTASETLVKGFPFSLRHSNLGIWGDAPAVGQHTGQFLSEY